MNSRQLTKSTNNKLLCGVIGGICEYFNWSRDVATILRILFVILAFSSFGGLIPLYFVAAWIMPSGYARRDRYNNRDNRYERDSYEARWEDKANRFADKFSEKMDEQAQKFGDKMNRKYQDKYSDKTYEDKWTSGSWNNHSGSWNDSWQAPQDERKMKEAEPVDKESEDDWSDF